MAENGDNKLDRFLPALCLVLALATVAIVYFLHRGDTALHRLTIVVGYILVILVFFFGLVVLVAMATNRIDLSGLLCEPTENKASMSRFQLLIFTFVIAFSLVLIILSTDPPTFPNVPSSILMLLGISASTYAVSKGIQAGKDSGGENGSRPAADQTVTSTQDAATGKVVTRVHDHPSGQTTTTVHDPNTGETKTTVHNPTTVTTTTKVDPPPPAET